MERLRHLDRKVRKNNAFLSFLLFRDVNLMFKIEPFTFTTRKSNNIEIPVEL